jgi:predicted ATP-dependent Lon-type protease
MEPPVVLSRILSRGSVTGGCWCVMRIERNKCARGRAHQVRLQEARPMGIAPVSSLE